MQSLPAGASSPNAESRRPLAGATCTRNCRRAGSKGVIMETATSYLGMRLEHPFIAGASPFGYHLDTIKRLEDAGCAAIVLHSLFEEQITCEQAGHIAHVNVFERDS